MTTKLDWRTPAYPPPAWLFRMLNLPVDAPAKDYYEAFERLVVEPLRFATDAEIFSRLAMEKQSLHGLAYPDAVQAAARENPRLAEDADVQALVADARQQTISTPVNYSTINDE
ncbi:hypothetical protein [Cerasicoccus fimbriatus]|uniref:hypothetical protein n=1 Tax=Cerasicoccus fimbriatus TaxID=3014554 RepID=UPI0022B4E9E1|nr:hypothetical protein [Cerasicoccus sp. TK19100]